MYGRGMCGTLGCYCSDLAFGIDDCLCPEKDINGNHPFEAHRLWYHSSLDSRAIKKKQPSGREQLKCFQILKMAQAKARIWSSLPCLFRVGSRAGRWGGSAQTPPSESMTASVRRRTSTVTAQSPEKDHILALTWDIFSANIFQSTWVVPGRCVLMSFSWLEVGNSLHSFEDVRTENG